MTEITFGGWSEYTIEFNAEAKEAFETALKGLTGVNYKPTAVATQIVNGTNFSFLCNAHGVYPGGHNQAAIVDVNWPSNGIPTLTNIRIYNP